MWLALMVPTCCPRQRTSPCGWRWWYLPAVLVGVHLHVVGVDGGVKHDPSAATELGLRREVDEHRLLVVAQPVHDVRTELDHLVEHVCNRNRQNVNIIVDSFAESEQIVGRHIVVLH